MRGLNVGSSTTSALSCILAYLQVDLFFFLSFPQSASTYRCQRAIKREEGAEEESRGSSGGGHKQRWRDSGALTDRGERAHGN